MSLIRDLRRVLLIDNSLEKRQLYTEFLNQEQRCNYQIFEAATGKEGLKLAQNIKPSVILLNYLLPDLEAREFLEQLQQIKQDFPILLIISAKNEELGIAAIKNGAQDYLLAEKLTSTGLCRAVFNGIERAALLKTIKKDREKLQLVGDIALRIRQSLNLEDILQSTVTEVRKLLECDRVLIYQFQSDLSCKIVSESVVVGWQSYLKIQTEDNSCLQYASYAYRQRQTQAINNIYQAGLSNNQIELLERFQVKASLIVPILLDGNNSNSLWGLLIAHQCSDFRKWQETELQLLEKLAIQMAIAIQQAILFQELETKNLALTEELKFSKLRLEISNLLTQEKDLPVSLQEITQALVTYLNAAFARIWLLNPVTDILELVASAGIYTHLNGRHARIKLGEYKVGKIAQSRCGIITNSVIGDRLIHDQEWAKRESIISFAGYPMIVEDKAIGVVVMFARHPLTSRIGEELEAIANFLALAIERQYQQENLRRSEKRYRQIVETAQEGIWTIDQYAKTSYCNPQMATMLGYTIEEMQGRSLYEFMDASERRLAQKNFQRLQRDIKETYDFRFICNDGTYLWTMVSTVPLFGDRGQFQGALVMISDISDRQQTEEKLRQTNEKLIQVNKELEKATRLKDEFLASMSHELRTPLNSIIGFTEALQEEVYGALREEQKPILTSIASSSYHLLELINDILDLAKIEAGKMELQLAPTSVKQICSSSLNFVKQQAYKKNIKLNYQVAPGIEIIKVDERRIRQVLINLLSNGVKFTPEGGEVSLEVTANLEENRVAFTVIDTGIGIASEDFEKLFQSFVQIDSSLSRLYPGTGLGLSLVQRLTQMHGGTVTVASEIGVGSKFTVFLPNNIACSDTASGLVRDTNSSLSTSLSSSEPPVILILDNCEEDRESLWDYLSARGYTLIQAKDEQEAIALAKTQKPKLILIGIPLSDLVEPLRLISWEI
jgi:PAS domain S-box-containing protein